ncbi:MAG: hypothetical protein ACI4SB_03830 [Acutalibacteraceae bacterium]
MICKFCGNEIDDGSDFCYICGQKVEESVSADAADVYSQPVAQATVAEPAYAAAAANAQAAAAPAYTAAPVQAPAAPAYAAAPGQAPVDPAYAAPVQPEGKKKKAKKPRDPNMATRAQRFFSFILFFIVGPILYNKEKKAGNEAKAISILNAAMRGFCIFMAIIVVVMIKKFMLN